MLVVFLLTSTAAWSSWILVFTFQFSFPGISLFYLLDFDSLGIPLLPSFDSSGRACPMSLPRPSSLAIHWWNGCEYSYIETLLTLLLRPDCSAAVLVVSLILLSSIVCYFSSISFSGCILWTDNRVCIIMCIVNCVNIYSWAYFCLYDLFSLLVKILVVWLWLKLQASSHSYLLSIYISFQISMLSGPPALS